MSFNVNASQVRGVNGLDELEGLLGLLGLGAETVAHEVRDELPEAREGRVARYGDRRSRGYGVLLADLDAHPRSFQRVGRHLLESVHDRPLAFTGVRGDDGDWAELVVLRPRWVVKHQEDHRKEVLEVARLTVDLAHPTAHDLHVLNELGWSSVDDADGGRTGQDRIDRAFDTERVTKRFFSGLAHHHERILVAVEDACDDQDVKEGVAAAGGAERVALRLLTQTLFVYFLQRKGLLEGDRHWLTTKARQAAWQGLSIHASVLESLFYDALARPAEQRADPWRDAAIPFLNGGLFERLYGEVSLPLPSEVVDDREGLIGFLDGWTFTVAEEVPGEPEVAVDPEMLGKVFESLISDEEKERHGVIYTPRPVVRFMCREALVPYLQQRLGIGEDLTRALLTDDHADDEVAAMHASPEETQEFFTQLDSAAAEVTVLDPAVGSGAFLLGMLSELLRLRSMAHRRLHGTEPRSDMMHAWKAEAVGRCLFGVDIEPGAVEICMLRLWLALIVDAPGVPDPLPNLDYRIVCADSLTDFVDGVPVQHTRTSSGSNGQGDLSAVSVDMTRLSELRATYFAAADPQTKETLREELRGEEDRVVADLLDRAKHSITRNNAERDHLDEIAAAFASHERRMPVFMPEFTNPEVWQAEGWDLVLLNPPYLSRKNLPDDIKPDLEKHYGRTMDLMAHFGLRAFDYTRPGGTVALIGNDSWFTSTDAVDLRRHLFDASTHRVTALARTRCFEGVAVNGGVFVATKAPTDHRAQVRWVENHGCSPEQMLGASDPAAARREHYPVKDSELWVNWLGVFAKLPHRPAFRPSPEALEILARYEECVNWRSEFSILHEGSRGGQEGWGVLAQTRNLLKRHDAYRRAGIYERLQPGQFILAGLVTEGGQGLATADDRRFLGALDGTPEADETRVRQADYLDRAAANPHASQRIDELHTQGSDDEQVLVALNSEFTARDLGWPRSGLIRIADPAHVYSRELSEEVKEHGLEEPVHWLPLEKGDRSDEGAGARWVRRNPIVIDWSTEAVALLRRRAKHGPRKPRLQNERAWGRAGAAWNRVASYLRARRVPDGAIFSDMAPTVVPVKDCEWLSANVLLALFNSSAVDFTLRTFLGSRMHIEVGDVRGLPLPVLDDETSEELDRLAEDAVAAKLARDDADETGDSEARGHAAQQLQAIEEQIDQKVLALYGLDADADLWVVR